MSGIAVCGCKQCGVQCSLSLLYFPSVFFLFAEIDQHNRGITVDVDNLTEI